MAVDGDGRLLVHAPTVIADMAADLDLDRLVEPDRLGPAVDAALDGELARPADGPPLWDGRAGERIAALVADWLAARG